jgi:hypothetical protein
VEVGGFDPELRVGEDVDLVWRLVKAGWRVRYAPESEVHHHPRASLREMALQRFGYGSSAPVLQSRHPGAATPLHVGPHVAGIWLGGVALGPWAALAGLAASTFGGAAKGSRPQDRAEIAAIVLRGHLRATRYLARVLVREWLPITIVASVWSRRARRVAVGAFALDGLASRYPAGSPPLPSHFALRGLDLAAYAAGLWHGVIRSRSVQALRVRRLPADKLGHSRR